MVTKCQKHISGPLLDRVDIHIEVPQVDYQRLSSDRLGASSEAIQARVEAADWMQRNRFGERKIGRSMHAITCKADMHVGEIRQFCKLDYAGESPLRAAMRQLNLSMRPTTAS